MKVEIKDTNDTRKVATVAFEPQEVAAEEKKVLQLFSKHAKIPGFRPGKAPDQVIRSRFADGIKEEWSNRLATAARDAILEQDDLRVHQLLKIEPGEIIAEAPVEVVITLDARIRSETLRNRSGAAKPLTISRSKHGKKKVPKIRCSWPQRVWRPC